MSYCEVPEFHHETFPKARKVHRCCECWAPIAVGEKHLYWRMKFDGDFSTGRQHMLCREICMFIRDKFYIDECVYFGGLHEEWRGLNFEERRASWDENDRKVRGLYAKIKWRERCFYTRRKNVNGVIMKRKWGHPWEAC